MNDHIQGLLSGLDEGVHFRFWILIFAKGDGAISQSLRVTWIDSREKYGLQGEIWCFFFFAILRVSRVSEEVGFQFREGWISVWTQWTQMSG